MEKEVGNMRRRNSFSMMLLILSTMLTALVFVDQIHAQDWLANAQIEKKLVLYHSPNVPDTQNILTGFRKKYPFIEVETYRASGEKLLQKITMEARAGKNFSDAYLLSGFQTWLLKAMGLLLPYASPEREKVLAALKDSDGYWTGVYWNLEVLTYNTRMVRGPEAPKTWEDLLAPRWKPKSLWRRTTSIGTRRCSSSWAKKKGKFLCADWQRSSRKSALAILCSRNSSVPENLLLLRPFVFTRPRR
jgi:hypothetical protein